MNKDFNIDFEKLLEDSFSKQRALEGSVIKGTVVDIQGDMVVVDVGLKSEGRIPLKEFVRQEAINIGDVIDVYIERYEDRQGDILLSHEKAKQESTWQNLHASFEKKVPIEGTIINQVKGGLMVDLGGAMAFLPGSQVDVRPIKDLNTLIGEKMSFLVLKIDEQRSNIVISRRAVLEQTRAAGRSMLLSTLEQGQKLEGVVKNITDYGAFVDLGGVDGLLHVTDIAWKRVGHPSEVLTVGQKVAVVVTRFNKETQRISLGMKQLEKDPWKNVHERCKVGDRIKGTVTNITEYGAFVELDEGIEGLIYVAEMAWSRKSIVPSQVLKTGQEVEVMVLDLEPEKRRISLGLKQCTGNPFERFEKDYPIGTLLQGVIKDVTEFGLLVQLPGDIDGTIHKSDLSWTLRGDSALESYHIGDRLNMKVISINSQKEIVGLGIKQLESNPYEKDFQDLEKGKTVECKVVQVLDSGIEVSLENGLRTLIKRSDLSRLRSEQDPYRFSVGDLIEAKVVSANPAARRMTLSIRAQELEEEHDAMAEYHQQKGTETSALAQILKEALAEKS